MLKRTLFALIVCVCAGPQHVAADDLLAPVISKQARLEFAQLLLRQINQLADLVPLPRPSEVEWVDAEAAEIEKLDRNSPGYVSRLFRLNQLSEFKHVRLYNFLKELKATIGCILDPKVSVPREMYCWGAAAYLLGDTRVFGAEAISELQQSHRLAKAATAPAIAAMYEHYSRQIQERIVVRYLREQMQ